MATTFTVHEAKTHLSKLIARALDGEEIVIARGTEPAVKLEPVKPKERIGGRYRGQFTVPDSFFEPMSEEELKDWGW